jgi:leucyl aminopeptidase (aminopeptidase T)
MTTVVSNHRIRHSHMVSINRQIMLEGMRADFAELMNLVGGRRARQVNGLPLQDAARDGERNFRRNSSGQDQRHHHSRQMGNLPGGQIFTAPMNTNATFVVDGVVCDYLCDRFGDLKENPLTIEVENNRIRSLRSENKDLRDEFRVYTSTDENSNRVGEFAIGTNTACTHVIGHILQDEKIPGVHIAFGHPYAEHTGAKWLSKTHIDCVGRDFDVWFNGEQVMERGKFLV